MSKYGRELVQKKFESMSQPDRIEFKLNEIILKQINSQLDIFSLILIAFGILAIGLGAMANSLSMFEGMYDISIWFAMGGAASILYGLFIFILRVKFSSDVDKKFSETIEKRSKK